MLQPKTKQNTFTFVVGYRRLHKELRDDLTYILKQGVKVNILIKF